MTHKEARISKGFARQQCEAFADEFGMSIQSGVQTATISDGITTAEMALSSRRFVNKTTGESGARVDRFIANAAGTLAATTAGMIRVFISSAAGANKRLWREWQVTASTPSANALGYTNYTTSKIDGGLALKAGEQLWVTSHFSDTAGNQFDIIVEGGDF